MKGNDIKHLNVGNDASILINKAKNLGSYVDNKLSMESHASHFFKLLRSYDKSSGQDIKNDSCVSFYSFKLGLW